jgi:hypothetical protein
VGRLAGLVPERCSKPRSYLTYFSVAVRTPVKRLSDLWKRLTGLSMRRALLQGAFASAKSGASVCPSSA